MQQPDVTIRSQRHQPAEGTVLTEERPKPLHTRKIARYAVVGAGNTIFGYCCYAAFVAVYRHALPEPYRYLTVDLASVTATLIGVTVSFLTYKFLVFKTKGNYLREWLRCLLVYGAATLPGLFILPGLTRLLSTVPRLHAVSPYLAGAIVMGGTAICTYLAHNRFSFAAPGRPTQPLPNASAS